MKSSVNASINLNIDVQIDNLHVKVVNLVYTAPDSRWFVPEHSHADFEFHIIPAGKGRINIEGADLTVRGGEFYITGPDVQHRQQSDADDPMAEFCLECEIDIRGGGTGSGRSPANENLAMRQVLSRPYPCIFRDETGLSGTFEELFREADELQANHHLKMQILVIDLLADIFRTVLKTSKIRHTSVIHPLSADETRINRLIQFIEINYRRNITLDDASKVLFLSPRQINRLMKKKYNLTFHDYLQNHRVSIAGHLIQNSNFTIEEIAAKSGFSSHVYMYQVFRTKGLPPPAKLRKVSG